MGKAKRTNKSTDVHVMLDIFDYQGKKVCGLFDSGTNMEGQAYDIVWTRERGGWKEISFKLPFLIHKEANYRWDYIKNEFLLRLKYGSLTDWYIIHEPKKKKNGQGILNEVTCSHRSSILKTKNLYLSFESGSSSGITADEINGVGTIRELLEQVMANTGWTLSDNGDIDSLYETGTEESDSPVVKIRSFSSNGKEGAYKLITEICALFGAYPEFDGDAQTLTIWSEKHAQPQIELMIGRDLDSLEVDYNSEDIITRLYVEGDYGQDQYVGIDDVEANESHLSYILNFDYYREVGLFTEDHEAAYTRYMQDITEKTAAVKAKYAQVIEAQSSLDTLWGVFTYVLYKLENGVITKTYTGVSGKYVMKDEYVAFNQGDVIRIYKPDPGDASKVIVREVTLAEAGAPTFASDETFALKCISPTVGQAGSKETGIDAAIAIRDEAQTKLDQLLAEIAQNYEEEPGPETRIGKQLAKYRETIAEQNTKITNLTEGQLATDTTGMVTSAFEPVSPSVNLLWMDTSRTQAPTDILKKCTAVENGVATWVQIPYVVEDIPGLREIMKQALDTRVVLGTLEDEYKNLVYEQGEIEADFILAMGDLLKDGYWANDNYAIGQEDALYADAVEKMKLLSRPKVTYKLGFSSLLGTIGYKESQLKLNTAARVYDPSLNVNDILFVSKITRYLDDSSKDTVEVTNESVTLSGVSLDTILSRMTALSDMLQQKKTVYERAGAISDAGTLRTDLLEGKINLLTTQLSSALSNWYTDEQGNLIFESSTGDSAMMLTGEGFMIASGRKDDGTWNWRTMSTGNGIVADEITTGYLSADRIEAYSITADKLSSDVGQQLVLESDTAIIARVESILDERSAADLDLNITSTMPNWQIYDPNAGGGYAPDWSKDKLILTPVVTLGGETVSPDDAKLTLTWTRTPGTMTAYETVSDGTLTVNGSTVPKGSLVISDNFYRISQTDSIRYTCTANYTGISTVGKHDYVLSKVVNPLQRKSIEITGQNVFQYSGSTYNPAFITLTAHPENVDLLYWQYQNANGEWVNYPNASATSTLIVYPSSTTFVNDVLNIRVVSSVDGVWDSFKIVRVNGNTHVFLTEQNYIFNADKDGKLAATQVVSDLVCFKNGERKAINFGDVQIADPQSGENVGTLPEGMSVSYESRPNGDLRLKWNIAEGAMLGSPYATSGTIPIALLSPVEASLDFTWGKVIAGVKASQGQDGVGIESIETFYILSDSATTPPQDVGVASTLGSFRLGMSQLGRDEATPDSYIMTDELPYLWSYDVITYTDGRVVTTDKHVIGSKGEKGSSSVNFMLYTANGTVFTPDGAQTLPIEATLYEGTSRIPNAALTFAWKKVQGETATDLQDTSGSITVASGDVVSATTYRCSVTYKGTTYTSSVTLTDKTDTIIPSDTEPENPVVGMLWLDTSRTADKTRDALKRCIDDDPVTWEEVTVSNDDLKYIFQTTERLSTELTEVQGQFKVMVTRDAYEEGLHVLEQSVINQIPDKVSIEVSKETKGIADSLSALTTDVEALQNNVTSTFDFTTDGLIIGRKTGASSDALRMKLANNRLSFMQDSTEVAYISDHAMYIGDARVKDTLSIGDASSGWWDWMQLSDHSLALKWRG